MPCLDMADGIVSDLLMLEKGFITFDSSLGQNVYVVAPVICALCDNARASELVNHLGSCANKYCRICMVSYCKFYLFNFLFSLVVTPHQLLALQEVSLWLWNR